MPKNPKSKPSLGQSLVSNSGAVKSGKLSGRGERRERGKNRHDASDGGGATSGQGFSSVLEVSDLAEIMYDAELTGRDFTPQRRPVLVNQSQSQPANPLKSRNIAEELDVLRMPRRPNWSPKMTAAELEAAERNTFLEWRRNLAAVEDRRDKQMTPFEKNLEIWRQLWRVIERSDVLVQIVDARDPLLFYCPDLDVYVDELSTAERTKKRMLVLNKADLLSETVKRKWKTYFDQIGVRVLFFSAQQAAEEHNQTSTLASTDELLISSKETVEGSTTSRAKRVNIVDQHLLEELPAVPLLSRDVLVDEFRKLKPSWKAEEVHRKVAEGISPAPADTRVVVGMIGYPNVGKSSTINSIMGSKKVSVSSTPGRTKHLQTLLVDDEVMLCDCPGLVFPNFASSKGELITRGVLPIDQMRSSAEAMEIVCKTISRSELELVYGINLECDQADVEHTAAEELLEVHARARGFRNKHDQADRQRSARVILKDYVNGKLVYCTLPPHADAAGVGGPREGPKDEPNDQAMDGCTMPSTISLLHILQNLPEVDQKAYVLCDYWRYYLKTKEASSSVDLVLVRGPRPMGFRAPSSKLKSDYVLVNVEGTELLALLSSSGSLFRSASSSAGCRR
eukprot:CAMPEP_0184743012 /NCGR_PEP_ID=MMETSP0315-20130426/5914_1 /TAXON_ID=101924 /ORGANISM="Rhodosorus marinus, Strain UTEX LB 2760" /LENGTH=621 /DNA_ID=CAMNT_0027214099 /DNA_START=123 /DNA_END=1989 /DNA_ORIENTATION=+